jgi:hypothetical protein
LRRFEKNAFGVELADCLPCLIEKIKFASVRQEPDACSDYIVKRRYVWKLPGVLSNSYELLGMSEPSLIETMDDLADRIWWRGWR